MYTPVNDDTIPYCKSCSLIKDRNSCIIDNKTSLCGWGEIEDVCNVLGNIKECNDMYIEGCMWDRAKEQCVINSERDDDGDKSRTPMGCMKCGSIKHNHACNSMANCFWDNQTDGPTGICKACSEFNTMTNGLPDPSGSPDEDSCNNKSNRKCTFNPETKICERSQLYPLIYEWIWYNRWYLISLIVCIYLAWKLPELVRKVLNLEGWFVSIGLFIMRCILVFVTIPALLVYPGLTPADGEEGRRLYRDPPVDPKKIGYFDFLLGDSKNKYALWPSRVYDERWDDIIMDDNYLRNIVDLRISKNSLDWIGYFFRDPGKSWNNFVNSMGNTNSAIGVMFLLFQTMIFILYTLYSSTSGLNANMIWGYGAILVLLLGLPIGVMFLLFQTMIFILYKLYNYFTNTKQVMGSKFLEINIVISIGLLIGIKALFNSIENTATNIDEYYGKELDNPYTNDSILHNFYYIGSKEGDICPYGCMKYVGDKPKKCRDNRSVFALTGALDPDEKLDWINDPSKIANIQEWIYNDDGTICPPKKIKWRWPYDALCNDFRGKCVSNIKWNNNPLVTKPEVKEKIEKKADRQCGEYKKYNNNKCPINEQQSIKANINSTNYFSNNEGRYIKDINFECEIGDPEPDNCPFPGPLTILSNTDPFEQRKDINVWSYLYDKIAGPSPRRRIPPPSKINWQNEERYEIVNQNFTNDKLFG